MTDFQDDPYQCIGYCQTDPDSGVCLGCGRPAPGSVAAGARPDRWNEAAGAGSMPPESRFPIDPLS